MGVDGETVQLDPPGRHSPNGFAWGYTGNGPADTALAIVRHAIVRQAPGRAADAERLYQEFKRGFIAKLGLNEAFDLAASDVDGWLARRGIGRATGPQVPAAALDARPVRDQLLVLAIRDELSWSDISAVCGLDFESLAGVVNGAASTVTPEQARRFCEHLRCDPRQLWPARVVNETAELADVAGLADSVPLRTYLVQEEVAGGPVQQEIPLPRQVEI